VARLCAALRPREHIDGVPASEAAFLASTFWLADNYALQGKPDKARLVFERCSTSATASDCSPRNSIQWQDRNLAPAFSRVALVNTALISPV
jgi:hypothetical protein